MSDARPGKADAPASPFATNGEDPAATMRRGLESHRRGALAEAEECYRRVLAADPNQTEALHLLGLVAHATGNPAAAAELIEKAITRAPRHPVYHNNLGNALLSLRRPGEAASAFMRALELVPDFAECHNNLGLALSAQGRIADALASYGRALELKPGFPEFLVNLGNAYMMLGDAAKSEEAFRAAIRADPDQVTVRENLCRLLLDVHRFDDARAEADAAIARAHETPALFSARGRALMAAGRPVRAADDFRHALALDPGFEEARRNLDAALLRQPSDAFYHAALMAAHRRGDVKILIDVKGLRRMGSPVPIEYIANLEFVALVGAGGLAFWLTRWEIAGAISVLLVALHYIVDEKWILNRMSQRAMNLIEHDPTLWVKCWSMDAISLARPGETKPFGRAAGWHLLAEDLEAMHRQSVRDRT